MSARRKIGIIGAGTIARSLISAFAHSDDVEIAFVLARTGGPRPDLAVAPDILLTDAEDALAKRVDLVIEAALPEVSRSLAPRFLAQADFCAFSSTTLADESFERQIVGTSQASGHRFFVPHGAILGLDGIADGRSAITSVTITTFKSGQSLGLDPEAEGVAFEGTARDACRRFPRNVNVHAALAIAGLGFDRTKSRIITVPGSSLMRHRIQVEGTGLDWDLTITSNSLGGVTGSYTPLSAIGSISRILGSQGIQVV